MDSVPTAAGTPQQTNDGRFGIFTDSERDKRGSKSGSVSRRTPESGELNDGRLEGRGGETDREEEK